MPTNSLQYYEMQKKNHTKIPHIHTNTYTHFEVISEIIYLQQKMEHKKKNTIKWKYKSIINLKFFGITLPICLFIELAGTK